MWSNMWNLVNFQPIPDSLGHTSFKNCRYSGMYFYASMRVNFGIVFCIMNSSKFRDSDKSSIRKSRRFALRGSPLLPFPFFFPFRDQASKNRIHSRMTCKSRDTTTNSFLPHVQPSWNWMKYLDKKTNVSNNGSFVFEEINHILWRPDQIYHIWTV
jgi:hypothetical protein